MFNKFLKECDRFVENVYRIMSRYSCFDESDIKAFAYSHCASISNMFLSLFGKNLPFRYIKYFFKKAGQFKCYYYQENFKKFILDPHEIPFNWIPKNSFFDINKYLDDIDDNPVNVSQLIFLSICFNGMTIGGFVHEKSVNLEISEECNKFIAESMMSLLDRFDEFNDVMKKLL